MRVCLLQDPEYVAPDISRGPYTDQPDRATSLLVSVQKVFVVMAHFLT